MPTEPNLLHPSDQLMRTMERIYRYRMTTTSGGNLSVLEPDGEMWITPAGIDKGALTRDHIVRVGDDNGSQRGLRPSSEYPFHRAIYDRRPDLKAVVHAHPVALVAFSICGLVPNTRLFHQAHAVCGEPGFAPYALPGSRLLGVNIAEQFATGASCVVLENHGIVVGGESLSHAFQRFEALEFAAKTIIKASQIGKVQYLEDDQLKLAMNRGMALGNFDHSVVSAAEKEVRFQLSEFVRRGCRQRLLISTEGSYSARIDEHSFVITPSQQDRALLSIDDFVLVRNRDSERGKVASRATLAHAEIYRQHPDVQSIVFAHPVNATAFSLTDAVFDARTIPESYLFLRDVVKVPFGVQYDLEGGIAAHVSMSNPVVLLENDGVLVVGSSVFDVFDRLEVLESTAEAIINAQAIGSVAPMSDDIIDDLKSAFD